MLNKKIVENWSDALVNIGTNYDKLDLFHNQVFAVYKLFQSQPDFIHFFTNQNISRDDRKQHLKTALKGQIDPLLVNALLLMIDHRVFYGMLVILKQLTKKINDSHHIHYGKVWSVVALSPKQMIALESKISKKIGIKVILLNQIDPSLIAGIKIQIRNYVVDGSVKGRLGSLRDKTLLNKNFIH